MDFLIEQQLHIEHVLQNGHLAIELRAKSFLQKHNVKPPETHDLSEIFQKKFNLFSGGLWGRMALAKEDDAVRESYKKIKTAWNMNYRYMKWTYSNRDIDKHYRHYKEVLKWIDKL